MGGLGGKAPQTMFAAIVGMKTYKNLYLQIYTFENLHTAYRRARKGKRSRVEVAALGAICEPCPFL